MVEETWLWHGSRGLPHLSCNFNFDLHLSTCSYAYYNCSLLFDSFALFKIILTVLIKTFSFYQQPFGRCVTK